MPSAVILGGTGVVGWATARRLARHGWQVTVTGRDRRRMPQELIDLGVTFSSCERADTAGLKMILGERGHNLLVDCLCFTSADAKALLELSAGVGSTVMISSKAVYIDDVGNNVNSEVPPRFPKPIAESQPVMSPGIGDPMIGEGYGSHKVAAEQTLLDGDQPITVIRPSKIHGKGGTNPREWFFVKRCLDRRSAIVLAGDGRSIDHTTAAANIAALIEVVAEKPGKRILNCADPDAPTVLDIARTIATHLDHSFEEYVLGENADPALGQHPWMTATPIVLDTTAATSLGFAPVGDYAATVADAVDWMVTHATVDSAGRAMLSGVDPDWFTGLFDYEREDRFINRP